MTQQGTYDIFRNRADDLRDHLRRSIRAYHGRHGCLPATVVVSPKTVEEMHEALGSLDLPELAIETTGGCLAGELWLGRSPVEAEDVQDQQLAVELEA
jgi:hypothetical protein